MLRLEELEVRETPALVGPRPVDPTGTPVDVPNPFTPVYLNPTPGPVTYIAADVAGAIAGAVGK